MRNTAGSNPLLSGVKIKPYGPWRWWWRAHPSWQRQTMRCQTRAALLFAAILLLHVSAGHAGQKVSPSARSEISEQQAIEIARREIARRGLSVPKRSHPWAAAVVSDTEPVRRIYWVTFIDPYKAEKGIHSYEVMVDRNSGEIVDFVDPRTFITPQAAIEIAKRELSRRGISLPTNWGVNVGHGATPEGVTVERPLFVVSFYPPEKDKRSAVYQITIEKRTGEVESFFDTRKVVPPSTPHDR